jgi:hypothetical protein
MLHLEGPGYSARGRDGEHSFFVLKGSHARAGEQPSIPKHAAKQRRKLVEDGVVTKDEVGYRFTRDWSFDSPSAAACVIVGGSESGPRAWKDDHGRPLKDARQDK